MIARAMAGAVLGFSRKAYLTVLAVMMLVIILPKTAFADDGHCVLQIENKTIDGKRYREITLSNRDECDLWYVASQFPQVNPETGKALPRLAQLRSIWAANRTRIQDGKRVLASVHRGCVTGFGPWSSQTEEEKQGCDGRINYYPVAAYGGNAKILIPRIPEKTITEKYSALSSESCHELATIPNPSDKVRSVLANCQKHFADIVIPPKAEPQETTEQRLLREARETISTLESKVAEQRKTITAIAPYVPKSKHMGWGLAASLLLNCLALVWVKRERNVRQRFESLTKLTRFEVDAHIAEQVRKEVETRIRQAKDFLSGSPEAAEHEVLAFAFDKAKADLVAALSVAEDLQSRFDASQKQSVEAIRKLEAQLNESVGNVARLIGTNHELEVLIKEAESRALEAGTFVDKAFTARDRALDALKAKQAELNQAQAMLERLKNEKQTDQDKIGELTKRVALFEQQKAELEAKLERMTAQVAAIPPAHRSRTRPYSAEMKSAEADDARSTENNQRDLRKQTLPYFSAVREEAQSTEKNGEDSPAINSGEHFHLLAKLEELFLFMISNQDRWMRGMKATIQRLKQHGDDISDQLMLAESSEDDAELRKRLTGVLRLIARLENDVAQTAVLNQQVLVEISRLPWNAKQATKLVALLYQEQGRALEEHTKQAELTRLVDDLSLPVGNTVEAAWNALVDEMVSLFDLDGNKIKCKPPKQQVGFLLAPLHHVVDEFRTSSQQVNTVRAELALTQEARESIQLRYNQLKAKIAEAEPDVKPDNALVISQANRDFVAALDSTDLMCLTSICVSVITDRVHNRKQLDLAIASMDDVHSWHDFLRLPVVSSGDYHLPHTLQELVLRMGSLRIAHLAHGSCKRLVGGAVKTMAPPPMVQLDAHILRRPGDDEGE